MSINKNKITKELLEKAMQCETAEDLITFAKTQGVEITKEEAESLPPTLCNQPLFSIIAPLVTVQTLA